MGVKASQMTKEGFWREDRFLGLVIALLLLITTNSTFIQSLERGALYSGVLASNRLPSSRIYVIRMDDQSIATIDCWPYVWTCARI